MKKIIVILFCVYMAFLLEVGLFNNFGVWGKPELLTLLVVFFSLYLGIRFGIVTALWAGILRDGVSISPAGLNILVYLSVAYLCVYLRRYLFQPGSKFSRLLMAFMGTVVAFIVHAGLSMSRQDFFIEELVAFVLAPQLLTTMVSATVVFTLLKSMSERIRLKS